MKTIADWLSRVGMHEYVAKWLQPNSDEPTYSGANKNGLCVQTDIRRLRKTTRFERNDRNDAQTRSC
jgi:hypothetical protein